MEKNKVIEIEDADIWQSENRILSDISLDVKGRICLYYWKSWNRENQSN